MSRDARAVIQEHLAPKENLVWAGKPKTGIVFRNSDIFLIPFSIIWCGFSLFWEAGVIGMAFANENNESIDLFFPIFGIPFILIGLYLVFGRFWVDAKQRERCYYGITNERIIILSGLFRRTTKSINIKNITDLSLDEKANGNGTISFGPHSPFSSWNWPGTGFNSSPYLEMIKDAKQVYNIIRDIQTHKD